MSVNYRAMAAVGLVAVAAVMYMKVKRDRDRADEERAALEPATAATPDPTVFADGLQDARNAYALARNQDVARQGAGFAISAHAADLVLTVAGDTTCPGAIIDAFGRSGPSEVLKLGFQHVVCEPGGVQVRIR